jgi:hypothetical protein
MNDAPLPPTLPVYEAPKPRPTAILPQGLEVTKMPSTMNKMISKMLPKLGKLKAPKMKMKLPTGKPGKTKHKVKFK